MSIYITVYSAVVKCLLFRNVVVGLLANSQLDPTLCLLFIFGILTDRIHLNNTSRDPGRGSLIFPIEFHLISGRIIWPFLYLDTGTENGGKRTFYPARSGSVTFLP